MTIFATKVFNGEVPRLPADKLPEPYAQATNNCEFAYGELRAMKGLFPVTTLANNAKSIFSVDGLTFYSWEHRTKAWKGPVTNDMFSRMYFTDAAGALRVAQTTNTQPDGGEPGTQYKVGVPAVAAAPTYTLVDRTSLPDYPNAAIKLYSYYEADGKRFDEQEITSFTTLTPFREFTFTIPEASSSTASPDAVSTEGRTIRLAALTYEYNAGTDPESAPNYISTNITIGDAAAVVVDSTTVRVGDVYYYGVTSITPVAGSSTTPGAYLQGRADQVGAATPSTASPAVRIDLVDTVKNAVIFSLSASSSVASDRSDAIPGGVEARMMKDGTDPNAWKVTLEYGVTDSRAYVATMVNIWNEESKPSPPVIVQPTYLQSVVLSFTAPSFAGYVPCTTYRVYRSVGTGDYLSVTPSPVSFSQTAITHTDDLLTITDTDATLDSTTWDLPPTTLKALTLLPNGFFAAFDGDTLYFSEPFRPWAWPYAMTFPVPLVGMRAIENSLVVTTNSYPYIVNGVHPDAMTQAQLSQSQAGISDHGMCVVGNTVAYISNDGLAVVRGFDVDLSISQKLWTREVWRARMGAVLPDLELAFHDGALVCGCPSTGKMWELRLDSEAGGNLTSLNDMTANAMYVLPATDQLYLVQGKRLWQYKGGASPMTFLWQSRDIITPAYISLSVGFIRTDGPVTVRVYADDNLWHTETCYADKTFRMPTGRKVRKWSYKLEGTGTVRELKLASRVEELIRG